MLCATLERCISREAFLKEKQRYTHFVETISEGICRIDLGAPLRRTAPISQQREQLASSAVVAECNAAMARLLNQDRPAALINRPADLLLRYLDPNVLDELVEAGYHLRNHRVQVQGKTVRHFVVNTTAMERQGRIESLWISCTDVTEQVMLERRMVQVLEREQQQMGRDLHDRVGQQLAGTRMLMQNFSDRYLSGTDEQEGRRTIQRIVEGVKRATRDVSDLQRAVMPVQVGRDGLEQALQELASHVDQHAGVKSVYVHDGTDLRGHNDTKRQLYRIAQEAVRNALKHSGASTIEITLVTEDEDTLVLRIADDGDAFDSSSVDDADAVGLYSMRYRARLLGATLSIRTSPGAGTCIECRLPYADLPSETLPSTEGDPPSEG
jgi:signal transduction histidine kinase